MKSLKIAATIAIMAIILYYFISSFSYYSRFFNASFNNLRSFLSLIQTVLTILKDILLLVLGFIFLLSPSPVIKDKVYRLLRFMVVMTAFLYLPFTLYWVFSYPQKWLVYFTQAVEYFAVIVFLIAPPEKPIKRIDLSNYEMVAFTSGGHRFAHILLDRLFLFPLWLSTWETLIYNSYWDMPGVIQLYVILSYLLYCFLSESIFRQTFGKILTGSVVVSNGVRLSTGRILLRTLARLIPFDALSFLFGANWHDRTTSTAVVYNETWEKAFEESK